MPRVKQECTDCRGTGLYSGFAEAPGAAVICCGCDGRGWYNHVYKVFEKRKKKRGIHMISRSRGSFLATGVGGVGDSMTYAEFEKSIKS